MLFTHAILATLATSVLGHGVVQTPEPRTTGAKQEELCGAAVTKKLDSDIAGPIENSLAVADADYKCNLFQCRGYQYEDNEDNVRVVKAGEVIPFHIDLVAGHRPGHANVSVIDLANNTIIGEPLISWSDWPTTDPDPLADSKWIQKSAKLRVLPTDRHTADWNITIPDTLASACDVGGKCAIQWFWYAETNKQTYESCIDFYIGA
ncbi:uncharacterized protein BDZ83DRAFT_257216 [Colletotrichum acutatum]|uniref:Chitin-binding type-4 domain-containing protein n=1 Tax=Glomerella acutata TaxID=27357 RepID=A0AAD8X7R0_GLOAC|nr:uncharacterized protein BDZ83DRAFT_257216 [Colletotrichum acutatum]KAK1702423.1 hypothetical protein BDZ83DRAFT_257216 [Colletotrichum acutatum]